MARKRRPGGGRKPIGSVAKTATFTTRLEPSTRRALDQAAASKGLSVSVMADNLLKAALQKPTGAPRNQGLALAIALLAEDVERVTERSWRGDPFTADTLFRALVVFIAHFTPRLEKPVLVPPAVEAHAAKMPTADSAEQFRSPQGLAGLLAYRLYKQITDALPSEFNEWTMPVFFSASRESLGLIARDLGIAYSKKGKSK
jgi:hypothetical protein